MVIESPPYGLSQREILRGSLKGSRRFGHKLCAIEQDWGSRVRWLPSVAMWKVENFLIDTEDLQQDSCEVLAILEASVKADRCHVPSSFCHCFLTTTSSAYRCLYCIEVDASVFALRPHRPQSEGTSCIKPSNEQFSCSHHRTTTNRPAVSSCNTRSHHPPLRHSA